MTETLEQQTTHNRKAELFQKLKPHREVVIDLLKKRRVFEAVKYLNDQRITLNDFNFSLKHRFINRKQEEMFVDLFELLIQFKFSSWWHETEEDTSSTRGFYTYLNPADLKLYDLRTKQKAQEKQEALAMIKAIDADQGKFRD
jgi:hypothetical protein